MGWNWNIFWYLVTIFLLFTSQNFEDLNKRTYFMILPIAIIAIRAFLF